MAHEEVSQALWEHKEEPQLAFGKSEKASQSASLLSRVLSEDYAKEEKEAAPLRRHGIPGSCWLFQKYQEERSSETSAGPDRKGPCHPCSGILTLSQRLGKLLRD